MTTFFCEVNFTYRFFITVVVFSFCSARRLDHNSINTEFCCCCCCIFFISFIQNKINEALRFVFISPLCHYLISDMLHRDTPQHTHIYIEPFHCLGLWKELLYTRFRLWNVDYLVMEDMRDGEGVTLLFSFLFWSVKSPDKIIHIINGIVYAPDVYRVPKFFRWIHSDI